jgi:hypothetical protein
MSPRFSNNEEPWIIPNKPRMPTSVIIKKKYIDSAKTKNLEYASGRYRE